MREIVFDTETTGLSVTGGDRMVEIGCIELINRVETGNNFHAYFNPERPMPAEAQAVHGLSDVFLSDKPKFADRADALLAYLGDDAKLIAHNASFDFGFVDGELVRTGREPLDRARMIDTVAMARRLHPGGKHSLDALCTRYGIDRSHRVQHGALLDAELLAQLYIEMTGGRQIGLALVEAGEPVAQYCGTASDRLVPPNRVFSAPRPHFASAEELTRHAEFIAQMEAPLWADAP